MKLDLLYEIMVPGADRETEKERYRDAIEQVVLADRLGLNTAWFVEHHFRPEMSHCSAPEVVLGALSQITSQIRLGFGVSLVPSKFTHPIKVAERVATVDLLSGGRVEWGAGRSSPLEQMGFGVAIDGRTKREWLENVGHIVGMWTNDTYSADTELLAMPERPVLPRPTQLPHPPPWLACVSNESVEMAGLNRVGLLSFSLFRPLDDLARSIAIYRDAWSRGTALTGVENDQVAPYTLVYCCETEDELDDPELWENLNWWYAAFVKFGRLNQELVNDRTRHMGPSQYTAALARVEGREDTIAAREVTVGAIDISQMAAKADAGGLHASDFLAQDMIIVGTPDQCIEKIKRYADIGADHLACTVEFGNFPHEKVMRSLELLGTKVMPAVATYPVAR